MVQPEILKQSYGRVYYKLIYITRFINRAE